jgi:hypothetical protein
VAVLVAAVALPVVAIPVSLAAAGGSEDVKGHATYSGVSSQGSVCGTTQDQPCEVTVTTNGAGTKAGVSLQLVAQCDNGSPAFTTQTLLGSDKIKPSGELKPLTVVSDNTGTTVSTGLEFSAHTETKVDVQFTRTGKHYKAKGILDSTTDATFSDGTARHCVSGPVSATLRP